MRSLVFTAILTAAFALTARAERPDNGLVTSCLAPGACFVINNSPCGSIMAVDRYGMAGVLGPNDPSLNIGAHTVQGACGVFAPPYYTGVPRMQLPQAHCTGDNCIVDLHGLQ